MTVREIIKTLPPLSAENDLALSAASAAAFKQIAEILYAESGIYLPQTKAAMVFARLAKRLRALRLANIQDYCDLISSDQGQTERETMICALTTNVTKFFREAHHFEHLQSLFVAKLNERMRRGDPVRLWSAGCSTGQEPYSMAVSILTACADVSRFDIKILATDIDVNVLETAKAGLYEEAELEPIPSAARSRWFSRRSDNLWECAPELRNLVSFKRLNLMGAWPMKMHFQCIFCRNVVIYFDDATQSRLWNRFHAQLEPDGVLCVGHSEKLSGPARKLFKSIGVTMYQSHGDKLR